MKCLAIGVVALATLASCAPPGGAQRNAFEGPLRSDYLQLVSASATAVTIDSAGREVTAKAPDGFCIPSDSIQLLGDAAFMVVAPCAGGPGDVGGVLSLSISNGPMSVSLDEMERRLRQGGAAALGYGGDAEDISLISLERRGEALFATVEDASEFGPAFAGDVIRRAFVEVNGRLAVASHISLRETARSPEEMRGALESLVDAVSAENA